MNKIYDPPKRRDTNIFGEYLCSMHLENNVNLQELLMNNSLLGVVVNGCLLQGHIF